MLERDEEGEDTEVKISQLRSNLEKHDNEYPMDWFNNTRIKRKRPDRDFSDKGTGGTDCAELKTHSYEVEPQEIVDESGFVIQAFFKVRQPFSTYAPR